MKTITKVAVLVVFSIALVCFILGFIPRFGYFPESNFDLASQSRLPRWFTLPDGLNREDVNVKLLYYIPFPFFKENVKAIFVGPPPDYETIEEKIGIAKAHPKAPKNRTQYPRYKTINFVGVEEVIEHREMSPLYYVTEK